MYFPAHFRVEDERLLLGLIRDHPFATLISSVDDVPFATHIPLIYVDGVLRGHVARANPHAEMMFERQALALFHGPHAYISPTWYAAPAPNVPTWNYAAVHVYGTPRLVPASETGALLLELTARFEAEALPLPVDYLEKMARAVVAFEIPIDRIEGKWKMSQNRAVADREAVTRTLSESHSEMDRAVSATMNQVNPDRRDV